MEGMGKNQRRRVCFVQFARWQHRDEVCHLRLRLVFDAVSLIALSVQGRYRRRRKHRRVHGVVNVVGDDEWKEVGISSK